jgi:hypothetical protein
LKKKPASKQRRSALDEISVDTPLTQNPGRWRELIGTAGKEAPENPTEQEAVAASASMLVSVMP